MEADLQPREGHFLFTSESVTSGHPDKLCDYISDSVLDACLAKDPNAKVACESAVKNSICMIFGEITVNGEVNFEQIFSLRHCYKRLTNLPQRSWVRGM